MKNRYIKIIAIISLGFIIVRNIEISKVYAAVSYRVGVDYHATGAGWNPDVQPGTVSTAFIKKYNQPEVRSKVISQLQSMVADGIRVIHTRLWMYPPNLYTDSNDAELHFPFTTQELANIKLYVQDVANLTDTNKNSVDLYLSPWGCANWGTGGNCYYSWDQTKQIYTQAYTDFFNTIGDIKRKDGKPAVTTSYITGEIMVSVKQDQAKLLKDMYPIFSSLAKSKDITPSAYFLVNQAASSEGQRLDYFKEAINFFTTNNLILPDRLDMSFYAWKTNGSYYETIKNIMTQLKALYPGKHFGIAETYYPQDPAERLALGQAFAYANKTLTEPQEVLFWTTPNSDLPPDMGNAGFPFDINSYLPQAYISSVLLSTAYNPWAVSVLGYNLKSGLKARVYDNQIRWGGDLSTSLFTDATWLSFQLPNNIPPSNCNINKTCSISVSLYDPIENKESNKVSLTLPATTAPPKTPSPTPSPIAIIPGDTDKDGDVDFIDFQNFKSDFNTFILRSDFDKSGKVDIFDYNILVANFGK